MAGEGTGELTVTLVPGTGKEFAEGVYKAGSIVTVKAAPAPGSSFSGWSGDASGTAKKITVTMNADKNITANFSATSALKITEKVSVVEAKSGVGALRIGRLELLASLWVPLYVQTAQLTATMKPMFTSKRVLPIRLAQSMKSSAKWPKPNMTR